MRSIADQVIVITGASSGIGRATAQMAARAGVRLVLAARGGDALDTTRQEAAALGAEALSVPTDVSDPAQVEELRRRAVERFGRIDTWINGAAVSVYGEALAVTPEEFRRVIEVDLLGTIYGTRAALETMRSQPDGGSIVNVSSALGDRGLPLQSAYCAAKFGINGFSESVRVEIEHDRLPINLAVIKPASIDTPFFQHARSKMDAAPKPVPPVYDPDLAAEAILYAATHPVRELPVGAASAGLSLFEKVSPRALDVGLAASGYATQRDDVDRPSSQGDNLFRPSTGPGSVRGGYGGRRFSLYTWLRTHPTASRLAVATAAVAGVAALENRRLGGDTNGTNGRSASDMRLRRM